MPAAPVPPHPSQPLHLARRPASPTALLQQPRGVADPGHPTSIPHRPTSSEVCLRPRCRLTPHSHYTWPAAQRPRTLFFAGELHGTTPHHMVPHGTAQYCTASHRHRHRCSHACVHVCTHAPAHPRTHAHTHTPTHPRTHAHTHTRTHAPTHHDKCDM